MNKILIIEDDPAILIGMEEYLSSSGYIVLTAKDGREGYKLALEKIPDLVLLDINLPSLNGLDVCKMLRQENFRNPVIMLTSLAERIDKVVGLEVGANDYITKPFDPRELLARIRANLRYRNEKPGSSTVLKDSDRDGLLERHLLAVLFSDMVGYSKMMNKDEKRALDILTIHNNIMKESIEIFSGKVIEIIGDAFLASFESATNALSCCRDIQSKFKTYNSKHDDEEKIRIRVGAHIGDIVEFEGKLKGDALNVAARIQQLAEPDSIYLSESFYLTVKGKTNTKFKMLGTFSLKNIEGQFDIYEIVQ